MNEVINIIMHNKFSKQYKIKFRFKVHKIRSPKYITMLQRINDNIIYHAVLSNLHSVVFLNEWIIDPAIPLAMPKTVHNFRVCAQLDEIESPKDSIIFCYTYVAKNK